MIRKIFRTNNRLRGDRFRDARNWRAAEAAYAKHLAVRPDDAAIHIQIGHAIKEQGRSDEAIGWYRSGAELLGDDADAYFHLGTLLKARGDKGDAMAAFRRAFTLDPFGPASRERLGRAVHAEEAANRIGQGATLFAVQDLFGYLKAHETMSGIQRVQAGIAMRAMSAPDVDAHFILTEIASAPDVLNPGEFWRIDSALLAAIVDYVGGEHIDHATLRTMLLDCEDRATRVRPVEGSTIILLGAFWGHGNTVERYDESRSSGVRIGLYIYDIIPITHPQFCDPPLVVDFTRSLCEACFIADFILTISDFTRFELSRFLTRHGGRMLPMATVPLAHSLTDHVRSDDHWPRQLRAIEGREYVAYVSTIEGRKNHLYVVNIWRALIAAGIAVPDLVFVGRKGWRIDDLLEILDETSNLDGHLHIVHGLSDSELGLVYEKSLFTMFTSFVEGWGLPVGESLLHGVPCVASTTSSVPEVGGAFVDYVDPFDLADGVRVVSRLLTDRAYLADRRRNIAEHFRPREWSDVGDDFLAKMVAFAALPREPLEYPFLREGVLLRSGDLCGEQIELADYVPNPQRLLFSAFYAAEPSVSWMKGNNGTFTINPRQAAGTAIMVYMKLAAPPWARDGVGTLRQAGADGRSVEFSLGELLGSLIVRVPMVVQPDGRCDLEFALSGEFEIEGDSRTFGLGLSAIGYARADECVMRQNLFEEFFVRAMVLNHDVPKLGSTSAIERGE